VAHEPEAEVKGGLTRRTVVASGLLALVIGAAFTVLLFAVADLRDAQLRAKQSEEVLVAANRLERLIVDVEAGERGFLVTGQDEVLQLWRSARAAIPEQAGTLEHLADAPAQQTRAQMLVQACTSYIREYSVPLVDAARRDPASARTVTVIEEGRRRIDAIRAQFDSFVATEYDLAEALARRADVAARNAFIAVAGGVVGSILLTVLFSIYLTGAIVRPVRRAATMAGRLADGDLSARLPERDVDEIGVLERSFNSMAASLEESREELAASRARIVATADQARRRIERDLHDGTQQRLVSLALDLRAIEAVMPPELPELRAQLAHIATELAGALDDLREISRGIHPAILSDGGLPPALKALARRSVVPVELDVDVSTRLPEQVEVAAYYVVSEALTNAAKHARASVVHVDVQARDGSLHLSVHDDGIGGATLGRGSGLIGLIDRVKALDGTISVTSPPGEGTALLVVLPSGAGSRQSGIPGSR
jgi:signal transduction histidine kinase